MRPPTTGIRAAGIAALVIAAAIVGACSGGASPAESGEPSGTIVEITARDYAFEPSSVTVPAGPVTFRVGNDGSQEHEFEIFRGDTVVDEIEGLVPGLTKDLAVTLDPGPYTFVCKIADHEQRGMSGTLTVEP